MPYTVQQFEYTFLSQGFYSIEDDILLPVRSDNPQDIIYPNPQVLFLVDTASLNYSDTEIQQIKKYPNLINVDFFSGYSNLYDSFTIEHNGYFYNKGQSIATLTTDENGVINVRNIQLRYNFNPISVRIIFRNIIFV